MVNWLLHERHASGPLVRLLAMVPDGVLWSKYGVILEDYHFRGPTTHLYCPLKAYKALATPLQLYGHVVFAGQPFKLPVGPIFGLN